MIDTAVEDPERVARGLVRLAQSHRQLCADFLRDHRDGMDTPAVAKFAARIRMFNRVMRPLPWPSQTCQTITTIGTPCSARRLTAWPRTLRPISCRSLLRPASEAPHPWGYRMQQTRATPSFPGMRLRRSPRARWRPTRPSYAKSPSERARGSGPRGGGSDGSRALPVSPLGPNQRLLPSLLHPVRIGISQRQGVCGECATSGDPWVLLT